jgi:signal transduction histidine kinase
MDQTDFLRGFDSFFSTKLGRGGVGLGLSVVRGAVTEHGGSLSIESKKKEGTAMTLSLPLFDGPDSKRPGLVHDTLSAPH